MTGGVETRALRKGKKWGRGLYRVFNFTLVCVIHGCGWSADYVYV
jgi:hypothetical protein